MNHRIAAQIRGWLSHLQMKLAVAGTLNTSPAAYTFHSVSPAAAYSAHRSPPSSLPAVRPKVYSFCHHPDAHATGAALLVKPIDFTFRRSIHCFEA